MQGSEELAKLASVHAEAKSLCNKRCEKAGQALADGVAPAAKQGKSAEKKACSAAAYHAKAVVAIMLSIGHGCSSCTATTRFLRRV